jgi:phosphate transport system substrate-binding protein
MSFLDFAHFDFPGSGGLRTLRIHPIWLLLTIAGIQSCSSKSNPAPVEDTLTSGRISVASAAEARTIIDREKGEFEKLYPQAEIHVTTRPSGEAIRALFAAECDLAVISRELEPEERSAAARGGLELEGYRFAKDALVVIVNVANPVENLALDDLKRIYLGKIHNWSELGGQNREIEPVFPDPRSDLAEFFVQQVMNGEQVQTRVAVVDDDSLAVAEVRARPGGIGFVSLAFAEHGAKTLRISPLTGLPYWKPDLEAVYQGDYPLTRALSFYVRANGPRVAHGLITYVTSNDGQRIVHEAGLLPTSVPVRFVRRSPLKGAH